jgi:hypothetical protein
MVLNHKSFIYFLLLFSYPLWAGQNSSAGIRFDLESAIPGNQNITTIYCPGVDILLRIDVYIINASNLDNYEINITYNPNQLIFISGEEDNPVTSEENVLKKNGGSTLGFICAANNGIINCANTLVGNQGRSTPDGEGLLVSLQFRTLIECPGTISFGLTEWYDHDGTTDLATDFGGDVTLPVEIHHISLSQEYNNILVAWETASELNNLGFNLWRDSSDTLSRIRVNQELIKGRGNSSINSTYSFLDESLLFTGDYYYELEQIDFDGSQSFYEVGSIFFDPIEKPSQIIPQSNSLSQNFPNPFNSKTRITYQLSVDNVVELIIVNQLGQVVTSLLSEFKKAGYHEITWDASYFPSGIYYYRFQAGDFVVIKKMILLR